MTPPRQDPLIIAVTTKMKTTDTDISNNFETTPYLMIITVRKGVQNMSFYNSKRELTGGPYVEYYDVKGFAIPKDLLDTSIRIAYINNLIIEQKAEVLITNSLPISCYREFKKHDILLFEAVGNVREAIFHLFQNKLFEIRY